MGLFSVRQRPGLYTTMQSPHRTRQQDEHWDRSQLLSRGVNLKAADLDDQIRRVTENKWANLTIEQLLAMIDQKHLDTVFELHWFRVLTNSISELSKWQGHISTKKPSNYFLSRFSFSHFQDLVSENPQHTCWSSFADSSLSSAKSFRTWYSRQPW